GPQPPFGEAGRDGRLHGEEQRLRDPGRPQPVGQRVIVQRVGQRPTRQPGENVIGRQETPAKRMIAGKSGAAHSGPLAAVAGEDEADLRRRRGRNPSDAAIRAGSPSVRAKRCAARSRCHPTADATSGTLSGAASMKSAYDAAVAFSAGREWADSNNSSAGRPTAPSVCPGKSSAASG